MNVTQVIGVTYDENVWQSKIVWENSDFGLEKVEKWLWNLSKMKSGTPVWCTSCPYASSQDLHIGTSIILMLYVSKP